MLKELQNSRQIPGELPRRWYHSARMDLVVWQTPGEAIAGFQPCYDKEDQEKALTWQRGSGLFHANVSTGEPVRLKQKESPILVGGERPDLRRIAQQYQQECSAIPAEITALILGVLQESPSASDSGDRWSP